VKLLRRPARLALLAALDIALHARARPVSSRALATRLDLPPRRLEAPLQALVRAGILKSVRGPAGGYELARERRRICLGEIVGAVLQHEAETEGEDVVRPLALESALEPMIAEAEARALETLDRITLDDLYARAVGEGAGGEDDVPGDFAI
jgi:Rrf2 family iron-sulfur cluster assembly transcriptional regulator